MAITLTAAAQARVQHFIAQAPQAIGLRFGVKQTGCTGWGYTIALAYESHAQDCVFVIDDIHIFVDQSSLPFIDGTEIDFAKQGLGETFVYHNPNVTAYCGCGESFTTVTQPDVPPSGTT